MSVESFKVGFVVIYGLPNSGKSTLLNSLLNHHLSIVSSKPQTTRYHLKGIKTTENYQIVFIDTPGFLTPKTKLETIMKTEIERAVKNDADIIVLLVEPDAEEIKKKYEYFEKVLSLKKKTILAINKIDTYKEDEVNQTIKLFTKISENDIIKISAKNKINLNKLEEVIVLNLPYSPPYYYDEILSDRWERYFVAEIIREEIFLNYYDEVPYSSCVEIEIFKETTNPIYILANIYVSKKTHKMIIIGEKGKAIKKLRESSEKKIKNFLNKDVKIELFVKVREDWQNDINFLNNLTKDYK